jgi:hypothetical protein
MLYSHVMAMDDSHSRITNELEIIFLHLQFTYFLPAFFPAIILICQLNISQQLTNINNKQAFSLSVCVGFNSAQPYRLGKFTEGVAYAQVEVKPD